MTPVTLLALLLALPAGAQMVDRSAPNPGDPGKLVSGQTAVLTKQTDDLHDALSNPGASAGDLHDQAAALFSLMDRRDASRVGALDLRGWAVPDRTSQGDVDGLVDRSAKTIAEADFKARLPSLKTEAPPAPDADLIASWRTGDDLNQAKMVGYDDNGKLGRGTMGAYLYTKVKALGVLFNKHFRSIQRWLGDEFAAATLIHEATHAKDDAKGKLNPVEVKKGEMSAYKQEYKYLRLVDPTGQKLAWARVNACAAGSTAPKIVCTYVNHLAMISFYGQKDDWKGLVTALGYHDRDGSPD
ncbi:MAG: hypothetical protein KGL53_04145 [Elusimicrobia bacterium]|nr:hypothetical protein [Elusimicrobiota bacterium]